MFRQLRRGIFGWMRAGLIAGALFARSPLLNRRSHKRRFHVRNIGGGNYECNWYRAGNGIIGRLARRRRHHHCRLSATRARTGSSASRRAATCATPRATGTTGSAGRRPRTTSWGWASALDAQGGDDYGSSAAGRRTATTRTARHRPTTGCGAHRPLRHRAHRRPTPTAPGTPAVDADQDSVPADADCDDLNRQIYPGAPEVVGDGLDQDCNGADAAGRVSAIVALPRRQLQPLDQVQVAARDRSPAGREVSVIVHGQAQGLPEVDASSRPARKGSVSLTKMFRKRVRLGAVDQRRRQHPERGRQGRAG